MVNALSEFLREIHLPSLLSFTIATPVSENQLEQFSRNFASPPPPIMFSLQSCMKRFGDSMEFFVKRFGVQLKSFHIDTPSTQTVNFYENLPNVKDLTLILYNFNRQFRAEDAIGTFKKLEVLSLCIYTVPDGYNIGAENRISSLMIDNNKNSLKSFTFKQDCYHTVTSLKWLYENPGLQLTRLVIDTEIYFRFNLQKACSIDYKLTHVKEFRCALKRYSVNLDAHDFYKWIIQIMPNLRSLEVEAFTSLTFTGIKLMVEELKMLRTIRLFGGAVSLRIKNWCSDYPNPDIRGNSIGGSYYDIMIRCPLEGPILIPPEPSNTCNIL